MTAEQIEEMVEKCKPKEDPIDRRILYEWTGMKLDIKEEFEDDSSWEDQIFDASVFIDNLIGYTD